MSSNHFPTASRNEGKQVSAQSFEFGIICALRVEAEAVDSMFDHYYHINEFKKQPNDSNVYTAGRIANHNVVLVHMPDMGKVHGATVSANLQHSFQVKLVLLVGVCGGAPFNGNEEIVLGDIIISNSVIEYDFGRQFPDGFEGTKTFNTNHGPVGQEIQAFLKKLEIPRVRKEIQANTRQHLSILLRKLKISDPGPNQDNLFESTRRHKHYNQDCDICNACYGKMDPICEKARTLSCDQLQCYENGLVPRQRLTDGRIPLIHIGKFASGDKVIKSAEDRDQLTTKEKVIAFEMEGAGIWGNLNCVIIKSVCDYADSHKNKIWQPYAAATAASGAKAFLEQWQSKRPITETERKSYLSTLDFAERTYREAEIEEADFDSCDWISKDSKYVKWMDSGRGIFGVKGKPGSGKSTLMKKIFRQLKKDQGGIILAYFYHRRGTELQHTQIGMFRTLLFQLLSQYPSIETDFWEAGREREQWAIETWRLEELRDLFSSTVLNAKKKIRIFVDALDEAGDDAQKVIQYFRRLDEKLKSIDAETSICFSCRHFPIITLNEGAEVCLEEHNHRDIESFVTTRLEEELQDARSEDIQSLRNHLLEKASGMFIWVSLVIPLVTTSYNDGDSLASIYKIIESVPQNLDDVYRHILTQVVKPAIRKETLHLMQWILLAQRPLSVGELICALASDDNVILPDQTSYKQTQGYVDSDERMKKWITSRSGGLAEIQTRIISPKAINTQYQVDNAVQFIHQSVIDFLREDKFQCLEDEKTQDSIARGHHRLARTCINYLRWKEAHLYPTELNAARWSFTRNHPNTGFSIYALECWPIHAKKAEMEGISQADIVSRVRKLRVGYLFDALSTLTIKDSDSRHRIVYITYTSRQLGPEQMTLPHTAARFSLLTVLKELQSEGEDLDKTEDGRRLIHIAAEKGNEDIIRVLAKAKTDFAARDRNGHGALSIAARHRRENVVRLLLELDTTGAQKEHFKDAIIEAVFSGNPSIVRTLVQSGADAKDGQALYAAILAQPANKPITEARLEAIRVLVQAGSDLNSSVGIYGTPLQVAVVRGKVQIVQLLVDAGADINAGTDIYCSTSPQLATLVEIFQVLHKAGGSLTAQGGAFKTAFQMVARYYSGMTVRSYSQPDKVSQMLRRLGLDPGLDQNLIPWPKPRDTRSWG